MQIYKSWLSFVPNKPTFLIGNTLTERLIRLASYSNIFAQFKLIVNYRICMYMCLQVSICQSFVYINVHSSVHFYREIINWKQKLYSVYLVLILFRIHFDISIAKESKKKKTYCTSLFIISLFIIRFPLKYEL